MASITRFEIKQLHGYKNVDLRLEDNTIILVGENGAGKTTILQLFYYLLSGQWNLIVTRFRFSELVLTIDGTPHVLKYSEFAQPLQDIIDARILHRLPSIVRFRLRRLRERQNGQLSISDIEGLCAEYDIPFHRLLREMDQEEQLDLFSVERGNKFESLSKSFWDIRKSLQAQILYLPTYRRIEQELNLIFKGMDDHNLLQHREMLKSRRETDTYIELIEFGMRDVQCNIKETLAQLTTFARANLNKLTFSYLSEIVEEKDQDIDLQDIRGASDSTVDNILDRIQDHILSDQSKQHLRESIRRVRDGEEISGRVQLICHYFSKLMKFQKQIQTRESQMTAFCDVCNEYMTDKELKYDGTAYQFSIVPKGNMPRSGKIELHHLSSGEKQIVSLFSHLYLSGKKSYFVLIDEPELSLSVPWQRRFLLDIKKGKFCSGLVAVTHSPFIYDNELKHYAHGLGEFIVS